MKPALSSSSPPGLAERQMEAVIGWLLAGGVISSVLLILAGLVWRRVISGHLGSDDVLTGMNVAELAAQEAREAISGRVQPRLLINLGILTLLLTPWTRVVVSVFFFARERNLKYTLITGFVLAVLSYSLFAK